MIPLNPNEGVSEALQLSARSPRFIASRIREGYDIGMKAMEQKSEMRVSAEVEQTVRERLLTLDDDRKKAVDARKAIAEIRRKLKSQKQR